MMSKSLDLSDAVRPFARSLAERSNYSRTFSLLSQYLKEKGSFGDINLDMSPAIEAQGQPVTTMAMDLLPRMEMSKPNAAHPTTAPSPRPVTMQSEAAQMTLFYAGRVLVFDNFPADKAKEIMLLASKTIFPSSGDVNINDLPGNERDININDLPPNERDININDLPGNELGNGLQRNPDLPSTSGCNPSTECLERPLQADASDLPIARKISLRRFLEKRKGRITAKAPYQIEETSTDASKA